MAIHSTAGTVISISAAAPATYDASGYNALTWTAIGEITNLGEFGREFAEILHKPIGTRATRKLKGSYNEGSLDLQLALDNDDAGQILMKAASLSDNAYSFKVLAQNGDKYFFPGLVMQWKRGFGAVDDITSANAMVSVTSSSTGVGVVEDLAP